MNKVFKVIWSEARNAYVVVSEIAKNHGSKSCSTKKLLTMLIATGVMTCASMAPAMAATDVDGNANVTVKKGATVTVAESAKVNVGKKATVNVDEEAALTVNNGAKVTFSKGAEIGFENRAKIKLGSNAGVTLADGATLSVAQGSNVSVDKNLAIGSGARTNTYNYNNVYGDKPITGDIAIGQNAYAWNGGYDKYKKIYIGTHEYYTDFGQGGIVDSLGRYQVVDGSKVAGSIAIGKNSVARTGSTILGDHTYNGKIGDTEIKSNTNYMNIQPAVFSTTIGSNTYNAGTLATVTGAFSIASSQFNGSGSYNTYAYGAQNTGATIYGSMNSIESATSNDWRTKGYSGVASSVLGFANRTQNANAALVWGTGNEVTNSIEAVTGVDFTKWNSMSVSEAQKDAIKAMQSNQYAGGSVLAIGGGNKADYATYSELTGVQNKVTGTAKAGAKYDLVNGYQNTVTNASDVTIIGIKNEVTADGNKVIGDNHQVSGTDNVIFGSADELTETTVNNAVVLGHNAKVTREGGVALGSGSVADRANAVSVGSVGAERQIINVKAGVEDTDAVNVSQLKEAGAAAKTEVKAGANVTSVVKTTGANGQDIYTVNAKDTTYAAGNGIEISGDKNEISVKLKEGENNLEVTADGLALKKALTVNSVNAGKFFMDNTNGVGYDGKAYITSSGLNANNQKITGVADGEVDSDAVNVSQLKKVADTANKGWTLSTNGNVTSGAQVAPGGFVDFSSDDENIKVSNKNTVVKVNLNKDLKGLNSVTANNAYVTNVDASKGSSVTNVDYVKQQISNVTLTAGNGISITDKKINVKLKDGEKNLVVDDKGLALNTALTGIQSINGTGAGSISFSGGNVTINNNVTFGSNGQIHNVTAGTATNDAVNVGQLNKVSAEAGKHTTLVNGENTKATLVKDDANGKQYKVDVDLSGYAKTDNVAVVYVDNNKEKSLHTTNSGKVGSNAIALGKGASAVANSVAIGNGAGVSVEGGVALGVGSVASTAAGELGYGAAEGETGIAWKATHGAVSVGSSVEGKEITRQITNVAAGTADTDAVNVAQLKKVSEAAASANKGWKLKTKNGNVSNVKPGDEVEFDGDANIQVGNDGNKVSVTLKNQLTGIQSITGVGGGKISFATGGNVKVNDVTIEKGGKITGVAEGEISETSKDAVNGSQLNAVKETVNKGWTLSTNGNVTSGAQVAPGGFVDFSSDDENIKVSNKGTAVKVNLNKDLKDLTSVTANNAYVTYVDASKGESVTNVEYVKNQIADAALSAGDGISITDKKINVKLKEGEQNLVVDSNGLALNTALTGIQSITGAGDGAGSISFADGVIKLNNKVTIDNTGKITGVADGEISATSKDAVNGSQLHKVAAAANAGWNLSTNGNATTGVTNVKPGDFVDFSGDKNISVSHDGTKVKVELNDELKDIKSISNGDKTISLDGTALLLKNGDATLAIAKGAAGMQNGAGASVVLNGTQTVINGGVTFDHTGKITNVKAGEADTDAVNVGQLKDYVAANDTHIKSGDYAVGEVTDSTGNKSQGVSMDIVNKEGKVTGTVTITDVAKASDVGDVNNIASDIKNKEGKTTVVDAVNNLNQKLDNKVGDLNYVEGGKGNYVTNGENTTTSIGKLDQALKDVADTAAKQHTTVSGSGNIVVENPTTNTDGGKNYNVKLADNITVNSVTANTFKADQTVMDKDGLKVGDKVSVTATAVTAGKTSISDEGVKVDGKTYISADGLNANDQKVTNVANGKVEKDSKDAINGGQLFDTETKINNHITNVENQVISNSNRIGQLSSRVNKVGAGAAALAALHPMDFDPDDKLTFSAGYGNYAGQNAAAIGAYYRPDEKVMFSVGGTVGNGENMVNAGVSFALDRTNHVSNSRTAMAREILDLRAEVNELKALVAKGGLGTIEEDKMKIFPDVAENHWAYEYIGKLAAAGIVEGYPDGNFNGDRMMSRYEFAAMLYRAMQKGAQLDSKIINEFAPEMGRIRVDRISGEDGDRDKIERVRVNAVKGERDHYGNKVAEKVAK